MVQLVQRVGINIKLIRKEKKMTREQLAEKCGLQTSYLAGVERGERNITLETLEKIINGLNISIKELFEDELISIDDSLNKSLLLEMFIDQLKGKSQKEIELIVEVSNKIFETYSK